MMAKKYYRASLPDKQEFTLMDGTKGGKRGVLLSEKRTALDEFLREHPGVDKYSIDEVAGEAFLQDRNVAVLGKSFFFCMG
jgi:hypothetical protein